MMAISTVTPPSPVVVVSATTNNHFQSIAAQQLQRLHRAFSLKKVLGDATENHNDIENIPDTNENGDGDDEAEPLLSLLTDNLLQKGWQVFDLVRTVPKGGHGSDDRTDGSITLRHGHDNRRVSGVATPFDRRMRSLVLWLVWPVLLQSLGTLFAHNHGLWDEVASKLLSPESARAVKNVRTIIQSFPDHGVVDVFKEYPAKDVVVSVMALSKLQRAVAYYEDLQEEEHNNNKNDDSTTSTDIASSISARLLHELAHYSVYANAAYGWKLDLAFKGKFRRNDLQTLLQSTGVMEDDVIAAEWSAKTLRPAYFVVRDRRLQTIVLCVRGTLSTTDILTDLCCTAEDFQTTATSPVPGLTRTHTHTHRAHQGFLHSAQSVSEAAKLIIQKTLAENPGYSLVLVGHSLGSGVVSVLGTMWEEDFPNLKVYGYGSPCVGPSDCKPTTCKNIVSVVGEGDPFAALSLGHVADTSSAIALLCEDEELRSIIMMRTDGPVERLEKQDLQWCAKMLMALWKKLVAEKMYPPGRVLYLRRKRSTDGKVVTSLREVPTEKFRELRLDPSMLDVSRHVPSLYEATLQQLWVDGHPGQPI